MTIHRHTRTAFAAVAGLALVLATAGFVGAPAADLLFKINKSIDVFGRVYKEIALNYVDEVDPEKFMQAGIDGMLGTLDPYTTYIDKEDGDEVDLLTTGKYGGIGVTVGVRDGAVRVITVMEGYSAQRQGIQVGDRFLQIDGRKVDTVQPAEIRSLTRGEPGTEVRVTVEREGEPAPLEFVLIREEVQVKNVTYHGFVDGGIGYIRLERFSRKAGEEVRAAIKELRLQGELRSLIVDLRGNPGGLLDAAVDVAGKFVPRGSLVVSTRGRRPEADKKYTSTEEPVLPDEPLAVLTDRASASASEILAGCVQDLDRGVVVGTRSFGKGLVQTIVPLEYGAQLKITTARYYAPSGRSIQEFDYLHQDRAGVFRMVPDSLKREYKTAHGRTVREHGGITPDSVVQSPDEGPMVRELLRKSMFFRFVTRYLARHVRDSVTEVDERMVADFREFLDAEKFDFQEESDAKVKDLREISSRLHYGPKLVADLDALSTALTAEKSRSFERYRDHIRAELRVELQARLHGERGRIEAMIRDDLQVRTAAAILRDRVLYRRMAGA